MNKHVKRMKKNGFDMTNKKHVRRKYNEFMEKYGESEEFREFCKGNPLLEKLRKDKKKGEFFKSTGNGVSYPTGFPTYDYRNGYRVYVEDENGKVVDSYVQVGISSGSVNMFVGESQSAKTTFCVQAASNIVRQFPSSFTLMIDAEGSMDLTRVRTLSRFSRNDFDDKFVLQNIMYLEEIIGIIYGIYEEKMENYKEYEYDTGLKDTYGRDIKMLEPTVVIGDSIPMFQVDDSKMGEMESITTGGRRAIALGNFMTKITGLAKKANIIVLLVNHLTDTITLSPRDFKKPKLPYMKSSKSLPGGTKPVYLSSTCSYFDPCEKYNYLENGFDGFKVKSQLWKTRTNKSGQFTSMVFDQSTGYDPILSLYQFAVDNDLIDGRNPKRYFKGMEDGARFDDRVIYKVLKEDPEVIKTLARVTRPKLEEMLSDNVMSDVDEQTLIDSVDDLDGVND